ncbi:MAG: TlpA disulfide reductase family protein [Solirubrobacterales bacterium]
MPGDRDPRESGPRQKPFNYVVIVGIAFFIVFAIALFNMLKTEDSGTVGLGPVLLGQKVPPFAVPVATSDLDGDANVDPENACSVDLEGAMRICDYFDRPLVMSFWFTKGSSECIEQQDVFEQLADRFGDRAGFVSINVRDDRDRVRELIAEHGWEVPVGYDRDGAVSNIYRVGGCPTYLFIEPGGVLKNAEVRSKTLSELETQVRSLLNSDGTEVKPTKTDS